MTCNNRKYGNINGKLLHDLGQHFIHGEKLFFSAAKRGSCNDQNQPKTSPDGAYRDYLVFWGLVDYMFKNPNASIDYALKGVFTAPQMKRLIRNLRIHRDLPVAALTEQQWGTIYETMVKYAPAFRWPRVRKGKLNNY